MRIIVTGAAGFVGPHFLAAMRGTLPAAVVCAFGSGSRPSEFAVDIRNEDAVGAILASVQPTHALHLAGVSSPPDAAANPRAAWETNVFGTINVARAILKHAPQCVLISAGSGEVYGASANEHGQLSENALLRPVNEYAVTKAAADLALGALSATEGLRCIRCRPFNHIGPGQEEKFAVPSFASQIAKIEAGLQPPIIKVGDLTPERDFLDVRDVARAYVKLVEHAAAFAPGEVVNLASGKATSIDTLLQSLLRKAGKNIAIEPDPARMRHGQIRRVCGDASKAKRMLGWNPTYALEQTIGDVLEDWRRRVRQLNA